MGALALAFRFDFSKHPLLIVLTALTITAILAGLIFAKLLRLAKPAPDEGGELEGRDLFGNRHDSAIYRR